MKSRSLQHVLFYPILALIVLVPLVFSKDLISVFTMPKLAVMRILTGLMLAVIGIWLIRKKSFLVWRSNINFFTLLYATWIIIATICSTAFAVSLFGIEGRFIGMFTLLNFLLIFIITLNVLNEDEYALWAMYGVIFTGAAASIYGILQFCYATFANTLSYIPFFNGDVPLFLSISSEKFNDIMPKLTVGQISNTKIAFITFYGVLFLYAAMVWAITQLTTSKKHKIWISILGISAGLMMLNFSRFNTLEIWTQSPEFRVFSTMGHANHFGALIASCVVMSGVAIKIAQKKPLKKLFALITMLFLITIVFTASRGAVLGLIVGVFAGVLVLMIKKRKELKKYAKKIFTTTLIAVISISAITTLFWKSIQTLPLVYRTQQTIDFMLAGNIPDRISWWLSSLEMIQDHPITGIGTEAFRNNFNLYRRTDYKLPTNNQYLVTPESTHFELLNIAVTQGIPGIIFYLCVIVSALWLSMKAIIKTQNNRRALIIGGFFMAAMTYLGQVLISFGIIPTMLFFYLCLAAAAGLSLRELSEKQSEMPYKPLVATVSTVLAVAIIALAIIHYQAHCWYSQGTIAEGKGNGNEAIENYEKSIHKLPLYYASYEGLAELFLTVTQNYNDVPTLIAFLNKAEENYLKAIELSPQMPHVYGNLAQVYSKFAHIARIKNDAMAEQSYIQKMKDAAENSVKLGRNNPIFPYNYADLLASHKLYFEAIKYLDDAREIDEEYGQIAYKVAQNYFELKNFDGALPYIEKARAKEPDNLDIRALQTKIVEARDQVKQ